MEKEMFCDLINAAIKEYNMFSKIKECLNFITYVEFGDTPLYEFTFKTLERYYDSAQIGFIMDYIYYNKSKNISVEQLYEKVN